MYACSHRIDPAARVFRAAHAHRLPDGTVEGYASLFGEIDQAPRHGDARRVRADACGCVASARADAVPARSGASRSASGRN